MQRFFGRLSADRQFGPLLKSEWVGSDEERPAGAVKGGRSPAKRTLDGARRTVQSSQAECGMVLHSVLEATARACRTNCLKRRSALPNPGMSGALISTRLESS